jgi:hypothetical protein
MVRLPKRVRWAVFGALLALGLSTAACSSGGPTRSTSAKKHATTTTTTTTTTPPTTTAPAPTTTSTSQPKGPVLIAVPNVIGLKIAPARAALKAADLRPVALNTPCNRGTTASQSVVDSLALPGAAPNFAVGARPLSPGSDVPKRTRIGIQWSGCFGGGTTVPNVVGLKFVAARQAILHAGLVWTCQDQGSPTTTIPHSTTVLSQSPAPGTREVAGAKVAFVMVKCPASSP